MLNLKFKKNNAFTLSEVLLTLAIIGIVAAISIPLLINNIQNAEHISGCKKAYSEWNTAWKKIIMNNGGSIKGLMISSFNVITEINKEYGVKKICYSTDNPKECWHSNGEWKQLDGTLKPDPTTTTCELNNGQLMYMFHRDVNCKVSLAGTLTDYCATVYVDINGHKPPNTVGRDIYLFGVTENNTNPVGAFDPYETRCGAATSGDGCAGWVISGKKY